MGEAAVRYPLEHVESLLSAERMHDAGYEPLGYSIKSRVGASLLAENYTPQQISKLFISVTNLAAQAEEIHELEDLRGIND